MADNDYNDQNGTTKTFSLVKSGILIAVGLVLLVIILLTIRGCTISKKIEKDAISEKQDEVVLVQEQQNSEDKSENLGSAEISQESEEISQSEPTETDRKEGEISEKNNTENVGEKLESENSSESTAKGNNEEGTESLFKVDEPVLGESKETAVLVSGKNVYRVGGTYYTYSLSLIIPNGEEYDIVKYFCSKRIYDEVSSGETVNAVYQLDENGIISITSISR